MSRLLLAFALLVAGWSAPLRAQIAGAETADANPPGATVIDSDELHMDQAGKTAVFTGNVVVNGTNFNLTCEEMTVFFTKDSKIDNIVAKGNVVINQPGRVTHCGQAQYFHDEDKFILTDQPDILDNSHHIQAPKITIYRAQQTMVTEGRTRTTIINQGGSSPAAKPPGAQAQSP